MKKITLILFSALLGLSFVACNDKCEHVYDNACDDACNKCKAERVITHEWVNADCDTPKTCENCGATEGESLGHEWVNADCDTPKTCENCGATEGESLGHAWVDATCDTPKTCGTCGATEGTVAEHQYETEYTVSEDGHYKKCICHPALDEILPHADENGDGDCDDCLYPLPVEYTVSLDREHEGVKVTFTNENGDSYTTYTNAEGVAAITLPNAEYEVAIEHYNSAHIWTDKDSAITLTKENNAYQASFEVTTELVEYGIYIYNPDGSICKKGIVFLYTPSGEVGGAFMINSAGMAITFKTNDDYFLSIHAGGGKYYAVSQFKKNGPSTISITLQEDTAPMTETVPIMLYDLMDLPYQSNFIAGLPYDNSYDFEAGESIYTYLPDAYGKIIKLGTDKLTLEYNGKTYTPNENGEISLDVEVGADAVIKLTATEACTENIEVSHPGSKSEPYYISFSVSEELTLTYTFYAGESKYFQFYINTDIMLAVTAQNADVTVNDVVATGEVAIENGVWNTICVTARGAGEITITFAVYQ